MPTWIQKPVDQRSTGVTMYCTSASQEEDDYATGVYIFGKSRSGGTETEY